MHADLKLNQITKLLPQEEYNMSDLQTIYTAFYADMNGIILSARSNAIRSVEYTRMMLYWHLGERIFIEDQSGQNRAEYGEYLIKNLAKELESEFS